MKDSLKVPSILYKISVFLLLLPTPLIAAPPETTSQKIAYVGSIGAIIIVPCMLFALFWTLHILPERIAYKRNHRQKEAIRVLIYLSLLFGGLLWPIAWIWTFSKPLRFRITRNGTLLDNADNQCHIIEIDQATTSQLNGLSQWSDEIDQLRAQIQSQQQMLDEYNKTTVIIAELQAAMTKLKAEHKENKKQ